MDILENLYEDEKIKLLEKFSKVEHDDIYLTEEDLSIPNIEELDKEEYFIFMLNQMNDKLKLYESKICIDDIDLKELIYNALENDDPDEALYTIWLLRGSWNNSIMYLH
jgi:hypothetical protein